MCIVGNKKNRIKLQKLQRLFDTCIAHVCVSIVFVINLGRNQHLNFPSLSTIQPCNYYIITQNRCLLERVQRNFADSHAEK